MKKVLFFGSALVLFLVVMFAAENNRSFLLAGDNQERAMVILNDLSKISEWKIEQNQSPQEKSDQNTSGVHDEILL